MTRENGYQKRDREIQRPRGVIEDCRLALDQLFANNAASVRNELINWVEKLTHALNKRG